MECTIIDEPYLSVGSGVDRTDTTGTDKCHLTDVIKYIEKQLGVSYQAFNNPKLTMDLGFLWERTLERTLGEAMGQRPGEVWLDDIVGSPDGIGPDLKDNINLALEEYKFTWKSSKTSPMENWYYMTQAKSYCKMLGLNVVIMRIIYVMGEYRGGGPVYRVARIKFTDKEIDTNWAMILKHKKEMMAE